MSRRTLAFVLALVACLATLPITAAQAAHKARKAPAGLKFYAPPSPLPAGKHGDVIWSRTITKGPVLKNAARTTLVLYRSNSLDGKAIAVSGTFAIPKGKAPKGGWPVISWAHGTTGSADVCAPSRDAAADPAHAYIAYAYPQFEQWLKKGYALAFTDYEGLGTPGPHPYLVGHSEGRGVLDIVRAARKLDPSIGKRFAIAGHSQGGQSALFAAADAPKWTPELQLRGVASFAPLSQLTTIIAAASALTTPGGLSGEGALILDSMTRAAGLNVNDFGTPEALALLPAGADEVPAPARPEGLVRCDRPVADPARRRAAGDAQPDARRDEPGAEDQGADPAAAGRERRDGVQGVHRPAQHAARRPGRQRHLPALPGRRPRRHRRRGRAQDDGLAEDALQVGSGSQRMAER